MLNNLTNFFNLIASKRIKTQLEDNDLIAIGTKQSRALGDYKPTAIRFDDLKSQLINQIDLASNTNFIYVSSTGNDLNNGSFAKPVQTLQAAKNLAQAGDVIYVFPGEYIIDNTAANGFPYTGNASSLNLWKDQVTYYFAAGAKLKVYNENPGGERIILFQPQDLSQASETCKIYGHLELEFLSFGGSLTAINGILLFDGVEFTGDSYGYEFYCEIKSIYTNTPAFGLNRTGRISPITMEESLAVITFKAEEYLHDYLGFGAINYGSVFTFRGGNNQINLDITYLKSQIITGSLNNIAGIIDLRAGINSKINVNINQAVIPDSFAVWAVSGGNLCKNVSVKFGQLYFGRGIIYSLQGTHDIDISGSFFDIDEANIYSNWSIITQTNVGLPKFTITGPIQINSNKRLISNRAANIILNSDIIYNYFPLMFISDPTGQVPGLVNENINPLVQVEIGGGLSNIILKGSVRGIKNGQLFNIPVGRLTLESFNIYLNVANYTNLVTGSFSTANAILNINNSNIYLNSAISAVNEQYTIINLNNSVIHVNNNEVMLKNTHTTLFAGRLRLLNSTLINNDHTVDTIEYTTAIVVSNHSAVKGTYTITNLEGVLIDQLPNL